VIDMAQTAELPISGQATSTVMVNLRQGAPSVKAPVLRKLNANISIPVQAIVVGDSVQGNPHWYRTSGDAYAWAGAFGLLNPIGATTAPGATPAPTLMRAAAVAVVNQPYCIDLYQGDNVLDSPGPLGGFSQVKAQGIAFLDHKASQGVNEKDSLVASRYSHWMNGGTITVTDVDGTTLNLAPRFGFYHFNGTGSATAEAANFVAAVKPIFNKGDDLCLDWEDIGASGFEQPASWADDFCKAVEDWCGFPIKVYGGNAPRQQLVASLASSTVIDNFANRRLWFCEYGSFNAKLLPLPWQSTGPFQWQDDGDQNGPGPHTIPGISNYCDNSTVVGAMTVAKLNAMWGGAQSVV
jgi:glycosyl hydrolase family 25